MEFLRKWSRNSMMCKRSMAPVTPLRPSVLMGRFFGVSFLTVGREAAMVSWKFWPFSNDVEKGWDVEVWITRLGWLGHFFDSKWRVVELSHLQVLRRESFFCWFKLVGRFRCQLCRWTIMIYPDEEVESCKISVSFLCFFQWPPMTFPIFPHFLPVFPWVCFPWVARAVMSWKVEGTPTWLSRTQLI